MCSVGTGQRIGATLLSFGVVNILTIFIIVNLLSIVKILTMIHYVRGDTND